MAWQIHRPHQIDIKSSKTNFLLLKISWKQPFCSLMGKLIKTFVRSTLSARHFNFMLTIIICHEQSKIIDEGVVKWVEIIVLSFLEPKLLWTPPESLLYCQTFLSILPLQTHSLVVDFFVYCPLLLMSNSRFIKSLYDAWL